jgi:hypothetical protein
METEKKNEEFTLESQASDDAKRQGLEYYGFGRYGKDGKTTHHVVDGKLQPVKGSDTKTPTKPSATKKQAVKKPLTKLPSFKQFKDSMAGAGHSATKQEWHRELDRVVVSAYEKQNPPTKLPPEAVSTTEEEKQDFESRLKKLGLGDVAAPPRTSSGIVNPKFMKVMIDHQKQFPYSREIWNRFGGAGGENPTWMPKVHTNE